MYIYFFPAKIAITVTMSEQGQIRLFATSQKKKIKNKRTEKKT